MNIDREGCKRIIKEAGLPIPVKSGCYFCPFQSKESLLRLLKKHPDLYAKAEALEKNCSRYPEMFLSYPEVGPLDVLRKTFEANQKTAIAEKKTTQRLLTCPLCEITDEGDEVDYTGYQNYHLQVKVPFISEKMNQK
jgi:hypothetical protein